ncbi:MAG: glycosyltransferase family A protein [Candidatus Nanopelagicales bacterium]|nr:glycosyltransferase family A protein [Candidatus Nanopelagicales bacterium]
MSVVVPVLNGMPYLPTTIDSILQQSHRTLEVVLSDGGSTDGSLEYLRSLDDDRIRLMQVPPGIGMAANWTAATEAATGVFIKAMSQDDVIDADLIARQVAALERTPGSVMVTARRHIIDARGRLLFRNRGCSGLGDGAHDRAAVLRACFRNGTNVVGEPFIVLFRREALLSTMPWDSPELLLLDLVQYDRVLVHGSAVVERRAGGSFRVSASSASTTLAHRQLDDFRAWQGRYVEEMHPATWDRVRGHVGSWTQATLRRVSYRVLRLRGAF